MVYRQQDDQDEGDVYTGTRVCRVCEVRKSMSEFHWTASRIHRARKCKACAHARQVEIRAGRREEQSAAVRAHHLRRVYGLTPEQVLAMLEEQGSACGLCGKPFGEASGERMHIDHCHETGHVRALLCHNCNVGIGHFQDDEALVLRAAAYLRTHRERLAELGPPPGRKLTRLERQANRRAAALRQHSSPEGKEALRQRGKKNQGMQNAFARLTEEDVLAIRATYALGGTSQQALATKYGVTQSHIGYIVRRKAWTHV
jgi:Recombination endonuclease VII